MVAVSACRGLGGGIRRTSVPAGQPHPKRRRRLSRLCADAGDGARSHDARQSRVGGDRPESGTPPGRFAEFFANGGLGRRGVSASNASSRRRRLRTILLAEGRSADRSPQDGAGSRSPRAPVRGPDGCGASARLSCANGLRISESVPSGIEATPFSGSRWRPRWPSYGSSSRPVVPGDTESNRRARRGNRSVLVGLFAVFVVPILAAYSLNVWWPHWSPFGRMNHGELVEPAWEGRTRGSCRTRRRALDPAAPGQRRPCDDVCEALLELTKRVHISLGKDYDRVVRMFIHRAGLPVGRVRSMDAGLILVPAPAAWFDRLEGDEPVLLVVDPRRQAVLQYPEELEAKGLARDLARMLKISKIG